MSETNETNETISILEVEELDTLLREVHKIDSKLLSGQFIIAHRDVGSLRAYLERARAAALRKVKKNLEQKKNPEQKKP